MRGMKNFIAHYIAEDVHDIILGILFKHNMRSLFQVAMYWNTENDFQSMLETYCTEKLNVKLELIPCGAAAPRRLRGELTSKPTDARSHYPFV